MNNRDKMTESAIESVVNNIYGYDCDENVAAIEKRGAKKLMSCFCSQDGYPSKKVQIYFGGTEEIELIIDCFISIKLNLPELSGIIDKINENIKGGDTESDLFSIKCEIYPDDI